MEVNQISVEKVDVELHHEEEGGTVEGRGLDNHMHYTKEYSERENIHLPRNSSTTVSWNQINILYGDYDGSTTEK